MLLIGTMKRFNTSNKESLSKLIAQISRRERSSSPIKASSRLVSSRRFDIPWREPAKWRARHAGPIQRRMCGVIIANSAILFRVLETEWRMISASWMTDGAPPHTPYSVNGKKHRYEEGLLTDQEENGAEKNNVGS